MSDQGEQTGTARDASDEVRTETSVLIAFVLATLGAVGFIVAFAIDLGQVWMGLFLTTALAGLGYGLVAWGHGLMPPGGEVEDRPPSASPADEEQEAGDYLRQRGLSIGRRGMLGAGLATALGATGLATLVPALSLGPSPGTALRHTAWSRRANLRLVTVDGTLVRADQLAIGGVLTVFPEGHSDEADSQTLLIKLGTDVPVREPTRTDWMAAGHVAYSKICTHAGCPVGLYEATKRLLFCPCHQSSFDVVEGARPLMGPATRKLPQLPLDVDDRGYLVATGDFPEAVGPGWWTRP